MKVSMYFINLKFFFKKGDKRYIRIDWVNIIKLYLYFFIFLREIGTRLK